MTVNLSKNNRCDTSSEHHNIKTFMARDNFSKIIFSAAGPWPLVLNPDVSTEAAVVIFSKILILFLRQLTTQHSQLSYLYSHLCLDCYLIGWDLGQYHWSPASTPELDLTSKVVIQEPLNAKYQTLFSFKLPSFQLKLLLFMCPDNFLMQFYI